MTQWAGVICGYIFEGEMPPDICPVCDAPKEFFRPLRDGTAEAVRRSDQSAGTVWPATASHMAYREYDAA